MPTPSLLAVRRPRAARAALVLGSLAVLAACGSQTLTPSAVPSTGQATSPSASAAPSATPLPTPPPTPQYTNPPDPRLARVIPDRLNGRRVIVPDHQQFAYTPGDMVPAYGELALRFRSLQVAYVEDPRLSLYAARVEGSLPTTRQLEPYLATAGEYVGIAGLHRREWRYRTIGGRVSWVRPEDDATVAGTMIYTWTGGEYVFLLIGTDDRLNRAMFAALPGEEAPAATPRPTPSASSTASGSPEESSGS
jgi:hypothetical protein